jgi:flagellar motor switch protein FliN/FliY
MADENLMNNSNESIDLLSGKQNFTAGADMDLESIEEVPVEVTVVLGEATITVDDLLKMGAGAIIELNRKVGEPVELYVNERCVAKGEIVIVDNKIGITMTEIIKNESKE